MNTARARVRSRRCINASTKRVCVQFGHFDDHLTETSIRTERISKREKARKTTETGLAASFQGGMCERRNCLTSSPMRTTHHHALAHTRCTTIVRFNLRTDFLRSLRHCLRLLKFYCGDFRLSLLFVEPSALVPQLKHKNFFDFGERERPQKLSHTPDFFFLQKKNIRCALTHNFSRQSRWTRHRTHQHLRLWSPPPRSRRRP